LASGPPERGRHDVSPGGTLRGG